MEVGFVEVVGWRSGERQAGTGMQNEKENVKKENQICKEVNKAKILSF